MSHHSNGQPRDPVGRWKGHPPTAQSPSPAPSPFQPMQGPPPEWGLPYRIQGPPAGIPLRGR